MPDYTNDENDYSFLGLDTVISTVQEAIENLENQAKEVANLDIPELVNKTSDNLDITKILLVVMAAGIVYLVMES